MNLLAEILSSRTRAEIFRLLFGLNTKPFHLREIGRIAGLSTGSIRQETAKLRKFGLIISRKDGNRVYFEADKTHPLYGDICRITLKTAGLTDILRDALATDSIHYAFVFGSVARGDATAGSDIDLLVIGEIGLRKVTSLLSGLTDKLGREINPHVFSEKEFARRLRRKEHLVSKVMSSPKIFVVGKEDDLKAMAK
jgi:predicted nucleotidyltransferase